MNINKWTMEVEAYLKLYVRLPSLCTVHHISHVPQTDNNIDQLLLRMYCLVSKRNSQHTNFISFIISAHKFYTQFAIWYLREWQIKRDLIFHNSFRWNKLNVVDGIRQNAVSANIKRNIVQVKSRCFPNIPSFWFYFSWPSCFH